MSFSGIILSWYARNKRNLPWRDTTDPYKIWISEIILQQTRVVQGLPYYEKFLEVFPTVDHLAAASEEQVLLLWQGLGYYSRARNMHKTAIMISGTMDGKFPETYLGLLGLRGVGDYTASAIASISFNLPEPVVDGNVYRVLSRYFGVSIPINSTRGITYFREMAKEVMDSDRIREYNQAIMEFGALQCIPSSPNCRECPLIGSCTALNENLVSELPVKLKKGRIRKRYFNYLVLIDPGQKTLLLKREGKGIWQHLYEFPLLESETELEKEEVVKRIPRTLFGHEILRVSQANPETKVHKLTHQHLHAKFWKVKLATRLDNGIPLEELPRYPVPVLLSDFIKTL